MGRLIFVLFVGLVILGAVLIFSKILDKEAEKNKDDAKKDFREEIEEVSKRVKDLNK